MQIWNGCNVFNIAGNPIKDINAKLTFLSSASKVVEWTPSSKFVAHQWTPIQSIQQSFIVKQNQTVTRTLFPLHLVSACSIHVAQSSTYTKIVVDMSTEKKTHKTMVGTHALCGNQLLYKSARSPHCGYQWDSYSCITESKKLCVSWEERNAIMLYAHVQHVQLNNANIHQCGQSTS